MGIVKSHAQDNILNLVIETLADGYASLGRLAQHLIKSTDFTRDREYIITREHAEGLTFLTETLPRLGEWFDRFVWKEKLERVEGFKPYDGLFPCFLRPFWIYFQKPIAEMSPADYELVRVIRTLLLGLKKLDVPSSSEKVANKLESFLKIEEELADFDVPLTPSLWRAQNLLDEFCDGYVPSCDHPKHGPGAVAGGERANEKWLWSHLYASVHREWPYWDYLYPVRSVVDGRNHRIQLAANASAYRLLEKVEEPTARLLFVPKDSRGPRIISCEPKELMYLQQGVSQALVNYITSHAFTKGHVNFDDQTVNAEIALRSSADKSFDTIDLSDASDRVSCQLVTFLFPREVSRKWLALRSTATILPSGKKLPLNKFAPMGSALCFPVESLVFWAIAVGAVWEQTRDLPLALASVYVFGDDIIIASGYTDQVMDVLSHAGLVVNRGKSFIGSHPFRESCGIEAMNGFNVTPFRVKKLPPSRSYDGDGIASWVKYAENTLLVCPRRSAFHARLVERLIGPIPRVPFEQPYLSIVDVQGTWDLSKYHATWNGQQCYYIARLITIRNRKRLSPMCGWHRLQRNLIVSCVDCDPEYVVERNSTLIRKKVKPITYLPMGSDTG